MAAGERVDARNTYPAESGLFRDAIAGSAPIGNDGVAYHVAHPVGGVKSGHVGGVLADLGLGETSLAVMPSRCWS